MTRTPTFFKHAPGHYIKKIATSQSLLTRVLRVIDKATLERGVGAVLCTIDKLSSFDRDNLIVPIWGKGIGHLFIGVKTGVASIAE